MNSYWIEQQARQHIDELSADARGDQLAHAEATAQVPAGRVGAFRRAATRRAHAWFNTIFWRSRREAARVR
jgi:hypothetical protein